MFTFSENLIAQLTTAALFLSGGLILGLLIEKVLLKKLLKLTEKTAWEGDDIIMASLKGIIIPLSTLGGAYLALLIMPSDKQLTTMVSPLIIAGIIMLVTTSASAITAEFVQLYSKKLPAVLPSSSIFINIARISVFVCGTLIALQTLGISITPLITALGVGGLAVALAFQDTLSNLFSGLQIIVSQQLKPGDYVQLDNGLEGIVEDITWRNTTIRSFTQNLIIVPNAKLSSAAITNYSKPVQHLICPLAIGLSYEADLAAVEKVILEVATTILKTTPGGDSEFSPLVRFHNFGNSAIEANILLRVQSYADQGLVKHEFIKALHARFKQENIDIPYPIQTILLKPSHNLRE